MAQVHGSKGVLWLDDQSGTCRNVSGDVTTITFNRTKNNPESTTLGKNTVQRIDGLRDLTMDVSAIFNSGPVPAIGSLLDEMYGGSLVSRAQYCPGGSVSGCPVYTASMLLQSYQNSTPVDGISVLSFGLAIAAGSVTAACLT